MTKIQTCVRKKVLGGAGVPGNSPTTPCTAPDLWKGIQEVFIEQVHNEPIGGWMDQQTEQNHTQSHQYSEKVDKFREWSIWKIM